MLLETFRDVGLLSLRQLLISRRLPFLFERSARFSPGVFEDQRALFSLPLPALEPDARDTVLPICRMMGIPASAAESVQTQLDRAEHVHFGFERTPHGCIAKCYLESALGRLVPETPELQFVAWKWFRSEDRPPVLTHYTRTTCSNLDTAESLFTKSLNARDCLIQPFFSALRRLTSDADELPRLLKVSEPGNVRCSWDINLYHAELALEQLSVPLRKIAADLNCPVPSFQNWWDLFCSQRLGHLAAGTDRQGRPFVTVYHSAPLPEC